MRSVSLELEILGRHQHPNLTVPFLKVIFDGNVLSFCDLFGAHVDFLFGAHVDFLMGQIQTSLVPCQDSVATSFQI